MSTSWDYWAKKDNIDTFRQSWATWAGCLGSGEWGGAGDVRQLRTRALPSPGRLPRWPPQSVRAPPAPHTQPVLQPQPGRRQIEHNKNCSHSVLTSHVTSCNIFLFKSSISITPVAMTTTSIDINIIDIITQVRVYICVIVPYILMTFPCCQGTTITIFTNIIIIM